MKLSLASMLLDTTLSQRHNGPHNMNSPQFSLISTRHIPHKSAFDSSPRITEVQTIQTPEGLVEVDFWRNPNGSIHHVGEPRKI